jgi:hypothetical protein
MCRYTIKFFECDHKTDDNVRGCALWEKTGTHCDIDNPAVKKREDCSIRSENVTGLCPRCQNRERARLLKEQEERARTEMAQEADRARIKEEEEERACKRREEEAEQARIEREHEEEMLRRDLEKARITDREEQRRNEEAHEAHLRRIQEADNVSWEARQKYEVPIVAEAAPISPPPPPPAPPASASRNIDYSQPPKDQSYGHHFIGGRRQPVHPSQKLAAEHPLSPTAPAIPQSPLAPVRRATTVKSPTPSFPSSVSGLSGVSTACQKLGKRLPPRDAPQGDFASELQAMWDRRGIKRETDEEEDDGISTASILPSESASQINGGIQKGRRRQQ